MIIKIKRSFLILLVASACAATQLQSEANQASTAAMPVSKLEDKKAKKERIDSEYIVFLKTNNCEKANWSRYEYGEYFHSISTHFKVTPYDLVFGDAYTTRKIRKDLLAEAKRNYFSYVNDEMPQPIHDKYFQIEDQKTVFNTSVKRDYECYKKLK
jgi:hypothetical protein